MSVSLKKAFFLAVMLFVLLLGLVGWTFKLVATPLVQHHYGASVHQVHLLADGPTPAINCPPPPFSKC